MHNNNKYLWKHYVTLYNPNANYFGCCTGLCPFLSQQKIYLFRCFTIRWKKKRPGQFHTLVDELIHSSKKCIVLTRLSGAGKSSTHLALLYQILPNPDCDILPILLTTGMIQECDTYQELGDQLNVL
jgi:hypothetical protein